MKRITLIILGFIPVRATAQVDVTAKMLSTLTQAFECAMLERTIYRAVNILPFDSLNVNLNSGAVPVHENGRYKCVYWRAFSLPVVFATVSFDEKLTDTSVVLDTTVRDFTAAEAAAFRIADVAAASLFDNPYVKPLPDTYMSIIPVINKTGRKVYVFSRSRNHSLCILGGDREYTFDEDDRIVDQLGIHLELSSPHITPYRPGMEFHDSWSHDLRYDPKKELSVTDMATVYFYTDKFGWENFFFKDQVGVYVYNFKMARLFRLSGYEYDQLINSEKYKALPK